jgi:hypothetical protein
MLPVLFLISLYECVWNEVRLVGELLLLWLLFLLYLYERKAACLIGMVMHTKIYYYECRVIN